jgi:Ferredoxin-like domain in Api92-like protein
MPNWVSNSMTIVGERVLIDKFVEREFDSDDYRPMPEELKHLHKGATKIGDKVVHTWRELEDGTSVEITPEEQLELLSKHGVLDWYEWNVQYIGCKWKPSDVGEWVRVNDNTARVNFDTPWGPPLELLRYMSAQFDVNIELRYCEGGMDYMGMSQFTGGDEWISYHESMSENCTPANHSKVECPDWWGDEVEAGDGCHCQFYTGHLREFLEDFHMHTGG